MIAIGIFLAGVAYVHWSGGTLGNGAITALRFLFGALGYAVPVVLVAAGATHARARAASARAAACGRAVLA